MESMGETLVFRWRGRLKKEYIVLLFYAVPKHLERKDPNAEKYEAIGDMTVCKFYLAALCSCAIWAI